MEQEEEEVRTPTEVEKEIFGESDDEVSSSEQESSEPEESEHEPEDEMEKPKSSKNRDLSAPSEKILEARREFDEALEKIKSTGNRRGPRIFETGAPVDLDDIGEKFVKRMARAADMDCDAIEEGRPALEKQKMLAEVIDMLTKRHFHEVLLDNEVLMSVRRWLEPLPNRTLPPPNIRKALLEVLKTIPIETVHLRESGLGKIVNFFSHRPSELDDIRRLSNELISSWARPVLQRSNTRRNNNDDNDEDSAGSTGRMRGTGQILKSDSLKAGESRRYSSGTVESRKQKQIVASLTRKKAKPNKF